MPMMAATRPASCGGTGSSAPLAESAIFVASSAAHTPTPRMMEAKAPVLLALLQYTPKANGTNAPHRGNKYAFSTISKMLNPAEALKYAYPYTSTANPTTHKRSVIRSLRSSSFRRSFRMFSAIIADGASKVPDAVDITADKSAPKNNT